jgi:chromosome partitioning protein
VCETRIAENVSVAESPSHNRSVFGHAPESRGAQDYTALLDELQACNFLQ